MPRRCSSQPSSANRNAGCRALRSKNSTSTPGTTSKILVSHDAALSWQVLPLPQQPNSCVWAIAFNPANPRQIVAGTKYGHLFTSENGGDGWPQPGREFSEIADVRGTPAVAQIKAGHQSIVKKN